MAIQLILELNFVRVNGAIFCADIFFDDKMFFDGTGPYLANQSRIIIKQQF